jgi:beta-glucosidase
MNDRNIIKAVRDGKLDEADLDKVVLRMLKFAYEGKNGETPVSERKPIDFEAHHALVRKAAANGAVLLKNDGALPLKGDEKLAVIGLLAKKLRYQGAGSSHINPPKTVSFAQALDENGIKYDYADGYTLKGDGYDANLIKEACEAAKGKDAVLVFIGLTDAYESEGFDRSHMEMPRSHNVLIEELAKVNKNIIAVLACGSPVELSACKENARAFLNVYLGGQAGGEAAYDVLYGKVNPCGKLAETFPNRLSDGIVTPYFPMGPRAVEYRESVYVGYRYYDSAKKDVAYPFGYGLSYTSFEYFDLKLSADRISEKDGLTVNFKVKNVGKTAGAEVAELYVKDDKSTIFRPEKELKGFKKIYLEAGETKEVEIKLDSRAFAYYNTAIKDWHVESGDFSVLVGASSRDIRLGGKVYVESADADAAIPDYTKTAPSYYSPEKCGEIPDAEFEALYGCALPGNEPYKKGGLTKNNSVGQITCSRAGRFICGLLTFGSKLVSKGAENPEMITQSVRDMPLRSFSGFTGGAVSQKSVDGLVDMCNGVKGGFGKFVKGFKKEKNG